MNAYEIRFKKETRVVIGAEDRGEVIRLLNENKGKLRQRARFDVVDTDCTVTETDEHEVPNGHGNWPPNNKAKQLWVTLDELEDTLRTWALWTHDKPPHVILVDHGNRPEYIQIDPFYLRHQKDDYADEPFHRRILVAERKTTAFCIISRSQRPRWEEGDELTEEIDRIVSSVYDVQRTHNGPPGRDTWSFHLNGLKEEGEE